MNEVWKQIEGYEGRYEVSNFGRIKSYVRGKEVVLDQNGSRGYKAVRLCLPDGSRSFQYVHRLVSKAFIPNTYNKPQVNHKDGCKTNNCVGNLEWVTCEENHIHATRNGLKAKGVKNGRAKLSENEVVSVRTIKAVAPHTSNKILARIYGVDPMCIKAIIQRKTWAHI